MELSTDLWGIVLAGGEGSRLLPWIQRMTGRPWPKQFWPIRYGETLLDLTRRRLTTLIPAERQLVVGTRAHAPYLESLKGRLAPSRLLVQPENRGTAAGIVWPLVVLDDEVGNVVVAIVPSDHMMSDDRRFMRSVARAAQVVVERPELIALLGFEPTSAETEYGWMEITRLAVPVLGEGVYPVRRFWEKPAAPVAEHLLAQGSLWNSFVMVGHVATLLRAAESAVPGVVTAFAPLRGMPPSPARDRALEEVYAALAPRDFSRDVLQRTAGQLVAVRVTNVAWTDLGTPRRVVGFFEAMERRPRWATLPSGVTPVHVGRRPRPRAVDRPATDGRRRRTA